MAEPIITCPHCQTEIHLTESLAAPLLAATRQRFEQQIARKDEEIALREQSVRNKERDVDDARLAMEKQVADRVESQIQSERARIVDEESRRARLSAAAELEDKARELADLQDVLRVRNEKLAEAQQAQADLIRKQRELDDARRELDLTVEKRVQDGLDAVRVQARQEADDSLRLRVLEKDQTIASMQQKIEELKQKSEQGSQQLQGEALELELEGLLRAKFPFDAIDPVPKGEFGGDVLQRVFGQGGLSHGAMLWESKRTKHWSDGWLAKLRDDQRAAKAEVAILISQALPKDVETFGLIDGVWVAHPRVAMQVATVLRHSLIQVGMAKLSTDGQQTKTEMVYQYLTGPRFRQRVEAIVEAFSSMKEDLDRERKAIMKQWAKRDEQIERVMLATVGMYGDLQGIAGKSLQEISGMELSVDPEGARALPDAR